MPQTEIVEGDPALKSARHTLFAGRELTAMKNGEEMGKSRGMNFYCKMCDDIKPSMGWKILDHPEMGRIRICSECNGGLND